MALPSDHNRLLSDCLDGAGKPMQYVTTLACVLAALFVLVYVLVPSFPVLPAAIAVGVFLLSLSVYVALEVTNV